MFPGQKNLSFSTINGDQAKWARRNKGALAVKSPVDSLNNLLYSPEWSGKVKPK
jgi:hypothetical protein